MGVHEDAKAALEVERGLARAGQNCWFSFECEGTVFHYLVPEPLEEARHRGTPLGGKYSARLDRAHHPHDKDHVHLYRGPTHVLAVNFDGTTRHGGGQRIPNRAAKGLLKTFPGIVLPPGNVLEVVEHEPWMSYMVEG